MSSFYYFHPAHLHKGDCSEWAPDSLAGLCENYKKSDWSVLSHFSKNKLQLVTAVKSLMPGVGECVALLCKGSNPFSVHRATLRAIKFYKEDLKFHRLQATVREGIIKNEEWLVSLGFEKEGILKSYEPGVNHTLYGRVL